MGAQNQRGFSAIEVVSVVLVAVAFAVTGYLAYTRLNNGEDTGAPSAVEQTEQAVTPSAPAIDDAGDLSRALEVLDQTNLDASTADAAELDSQISNF